MGDFGDFEEIEKPEGSPVQQEPSFRIRLPNKGEILGIVLQRLGGNRMSVRVGGGKLLNCRVPGKYKRKFWIREGDFVLVKLWPDDETKGDIYYLYRKGDAAQLRKKGLADGLTEEF